MRAVFLASKQPASSLEKWTASLQASGAAVRHITAWSGPGDLGRRQSGSACNTDAFLLGSGTALESHLAQYYSGDGLLLVSLELAQQTLPRSGTVLLVWLPQVPQDIVQACMSLPPGLTDASSVKGLLLVDGSPSLTLSVTHKALEGAGLHALARKPTVLVTRSAQAPQAAVQALLQLADALPSMPPPHPGASLVPGGVRIAVARDDTFSPCFPENLTLLHQAGAQLLFFSPLYDTSIPAGAACLYLSSGPIESERWQQLAANRPLLAAVRAFCDVGGMVLAEGAGLLYLSRTVDLDEEDGAHKHCVHEMAGVLPFKTRLLPEPQTAAVQLHVAPGNPLLPAGSRSRGYLCAQASIVLVEERQLQSLVLGVMGPNSSGGGKGLNTHFSTTYEVTVVPREHQQGLGGAESVAVDVVAVSNGDNGNPGVPLPEGYAVHNVLASSCLLYLPSEPSLAAQLVRRCACIDVAALAAGMAQHLGCAAATLAASKMQLQAALGSAAASRAGSRRQSIQDVPAWGATFSCNGGGGGNGTGMLAGPAGAASTQPNHHLQGAHYHHPTSALPPAGPTCVAALNGGDCSGAGCNAVCVPSSRQTSHMSHGSGVPGISPNLLPFPRRSLCGPVASQDAGCPSDVCPNAPQRQSSPLPPAHPGRSNLVPPGWRPSHDSPAAAASGYARQQVSPQQVVMSQQGSLVSISSSSAASATLPAVRPKLAAREEHEASVDALPASSSPGWAAGGPGAGCSEASPAAMERSSSCGTYSSQGAGQLDGGLSRQGAMHHAASAGAFTGYSPGSSYAISELPDQHLRRGGGGGLEDGGPAAAKYGPGFGWGAGALVPAVPAWSPVVAAAARHGSMGLLAPLGPASAPGHGGVVCCAPGACEALVAMGLANRLAGIGSDCDHPPDVCGSRRVVLGWVPQEEAPQGAAARGIRVVPPCIGTNTANPSGAAAISFTPAAAGGGRGGRASVDRCGARGGRVLLLDELALRQEPISVLVLPDPAELSEGECAQLEQALVETGLASPGGGPGGACDILHVSCRSLVDVMDLMLELGAAIGESQAASMLLERLQARLRRVLAAAAAAVSTRLGGAMTLGTSVPASPPLPRLPRVLVLQSLQPLVESGRWVPEMLALAGGTSCLAQPGGPDVALSWQDIRERAAPDFLVILTPLGDGSTRRAAPGHPGSGAAGGAGCQPHSGGGLHEQLAALAAQPGWWCLPAVRVSQVYLLQSSYCVRSGPRLVDGVELLARLLMPGQYSSSRKVPTGAVMRLSLAAGQRCRATLLPSYFVPMAF